VREARRLAEDLRRRARGRGAQRKLVSARRLDELADRAAKIARQIRQRLAGERITDRLVSMADPDARPIRKGKLRQPTEFGYVFQLTEVCENTRRGARGLIIPAATQPGSPNEPDLLPTTAAELRRLGLKPREIALDGGFFPDGVHLQLPDPQRVFINGRHSAGSKRTDRRLAKFRVGCEGRISHLKTPLRTQTITPQRPPRRAHLDRVDDPRLQPRHPRHPHQLTASPPLPDIHPEPICNHGRAPRARPCSFSMPPVYPGQVASYVTSVFFRYSTPGATGNANSMRAERGTAIVPPGVVVRVADAVPLQRVGACGQVYADRLRRVARLKDEVLSANVRQGVTR
jgi:hypothetical protein